MILRVLRSLAATALLVALVLVAPTALLTWGRLDALARLGPSALLTPDDGTVLLGFVTLVGWVAWFVFTLCVVVEAVAMATRWRVQPRLPGLSAVQGVAAGLLVASVALISPLSHRVAPAAPSSMEVVSARAAAVAVDGAMRYHPGGDIGARGDMGALGDVGVRGDVGSVTGGRVAPSPGDGPLDGDAGRVVEHVLGPQDDLWSLAERTYGDGTQWRRIVAANPGLDPDHLDPGRTIVLPGAPRGLPSTGSDGTDQHPESQNRPRTVTVRPGDTLSGLAERYLGEADQWPRIWELNRDLIDDPDLIDVGWRLVLPQVDDSPSTTTGSGTSPRSSTEAPADVGDRAASTASTPSAPAPGIPAPAASHATDPGTAARPSPVPSTSSSAATSVSPVRGAPASSTPTPTGPLALPDGGDGAGPTLDAVQAALGGLSLFLAGGIAGALAARRRQQLFTRAPGRRIPQVTGSAQRVKTLLDTAGTLTEPGHGDDEEAETRTAVSPTRSAITGASLSLVPSATAGSTSESTDVGERTPPVDVGGVEDLPPTTVVLGQEPDGAPMLLDLAEVGGLVTVDGPAEPARGMLAAMALSLVAALWSGGVEVVVAGQSLDWMDGLEEVTVSTPDAVCEDLRWWTFQPGPALRRVPVTRVVLVDETLGAVPDVADLRAHGIVLVMTGRPATPGTTIVLRSDGPDRWRGVVDGIEFDAQPVSEPLRRAVVDLVELTGRVEAEPAPWWAHDAEVTVGHEDLPDAGADPVPLPGWVPAELVRPEASQVEDGGSESSADPPARRAAQGDVSEGEVTTRREEQTVIEVVEETVAAGPSPVLRLLGPVDLIGARGTAPTKAQRQCLEYAAWILAHPGARSSSMSDSLLVAEATRRSNVSRLRRWLGADDAGKSYLPDAYDGCLRLSERVTTDWERFEVHLAGGVNRASDASLAAALDLVRGAPLADAAPGQWQWAEEWRLDMVQAIRDVGVELARRRMAAGDLEGARRALARAGTACPEDEVLMASRIRLAHLSDERDEVERLVYLLSRQARRIGVDLSDESVVLLQEVMEGRARARVV